MAHVSVRDDSLDVSGATLVEGLPGAGLVGKIAADHLVETMEMVHLGDVRCAGIPQVVSYGPEDSAVRPPVRIHAAPNADLVVLQSDIPVSPSSATGFADCIIEWLDGESISPVFISGLPVEEVETAPELYGVATGDGEHLLDEAGIVPPREGGLISGPTGALLAAAEERHIDGVGLVVQTEAQLPDPRAARVVLDGGIGALTGLAIETEALVEHEEEIRRARERLAEQLQSADDERSEAQPLRMFQ